MKTQIFSVYDSAAGRYLEPFFAPTPDVAIRGFREAANRPDHQFQKFPADYTLFQIGEYDAESGHIEPMPPHSLGNALQYQVGE